MMPYITVATVTLTDNRLLLLMPFSVTLTEAAFVSALVFFSVQFS